MNEHELEGAPTLFPRRPPLFRMTAIQAVACMAGETRGDKELLGTYCLLAVVKGQGSISIDGIGLPLFAGSCVMLLPGMIAELNYAGAGGMELYRLYFEALSEGESEADRQRAAEALLGRGEVEFRPFYRLVEFLEELYGKRHCAGEWESFRANAQLQDILARLAEQNRSRPEGDNALQAVERSIAFMHRSLHEDIAIEQLAEEAGIGRWQYNALFKSLTGTKPIDYLTDLRIHRAKELLLLPGHTLKAVAARAGFRDEYYFSRRFKQTVGVSPRQYADSQARQPRIMSLQYLGEVLSLGIKPVAASRGVLDLFRPQAVDVEGIEEPVEAEALLKLKPDLILFPSYVPKQLAEQLRKVAPAMEIDWFDDIYTRMTKIGGMLGKQREAKSWIRRYEAKAKQTREALSPYVREGETATAFIYDGAHRKLFVYGAHNFGHTLYRALQFAPPDKVKTLIGRHKRFRWTAIDAEAVTDYAGDRVFLAVTRDEPSKEWARAFTASELWTKLPAVRNGRAYVVEPKWGAYDPITLETHLDEMVRLLAVPSAEPGKRA
ncbi:helix-turn-helix domain-containing protein [Paenibacillus hodogayensis]|uniref:Helix-turn-helix domain-containing protein n=1 Tax=Paenibacillus hodogayensis TaxID=279208 RepID=A0ABV5VQ64_9BACL